MKLRAAPRVVVVVVALVLSSTLARAQGGDPDKLVEPIAPLEGARAPAPGAADPDDEEQHDEEAEPRGLPPREPTENEIRALLNADAREAQPILRRAARTAQLPDRRALGLLALVRVDPSRATARICARSLRIDPSPRVRRAAAECLGRLPAQHSSAHTPALVAALDDESLDVRTMAGWALSSVGDESALARVTALAASDDLRVARLFFDYANRLRARHGAPVSVDDEEKPAGVRGVPPADALMSQLGALETTGSTAWLALYGGMSGWLHGALFPAAHGGLVLQQLSALTALGGAVGGLAAFGSYGFFRARKLTLAHNIVQLGTFGTIAGYGAGLFGGGAQSGIDMATWGFSGSLVGTGVAMAMNEAFAPTPGALALGVATALGTGLSFGSLALGYTTDERAFYGGALLAGGAAGALTTVIAAPYDIGLLPIVGATAFGVTFASSAALLIGIAETAQLSGQQTLYTPGAGWSVAGGYLVGASVGAGLALLVPRDLDPFVASELRLTPPVVTLMPDHKDPTRPIALASLGGTF